MHFFHEQMTQLNKIPSENKWNSNYIRFYIIVKMKYLPCYVRDVFS